MSINDVHKREIIKELDFIVDRSNAIIDEAATNLTVFIEAISHVATQDEKFASVLGSYVASIEEVRRILRRAHGLLRECENL